MFDLSEWMEQMERDIWCVWNNTYRDWQHLIRTEYSDFESLTIPFEVTISRACVDASAHVATTIHVCSGTSAIHGKFKATAA